MVGSFQFKKEHRPDPSERKLFRENHVAWISIPFHSIPVLKDTV